jgi:hypothetical protein
MYARLLGLGLAALAFVGTAACDEALSSLTGPTPNLQPTFSSISQEIFNTTDASGRTACINCHHSNGRVPAGGLDLQASGAYTRLVNVASGQRPTLMRVKPGAPDDSYLVHKLDGRSGIVGTRMPRGTGPYLTDGQMLVIRRWIELGAPNN